MVSLPQPTTNTLLRGLDLRGKNIVITGVSSGIGLETARALVARGAAVTGSVRDIEKAQQSTVAVQQAALAGTGSFDLIELDLADLTSVRRAASVIRTKNVPIDLLIANAGAVATTYELTVDGFESQFASNFLGHFVLANRLRPLMQSGSRLITLTSNAHRLNDIDLDDLNFEKADYDLWAAYARAKTAASLLAVAFDAKYHKDGIRAATVHPGVVATDFVRNFNTETFQATFQSMIEHHNALGFPTFVPKTIEEGAATTLWAGLIADSSVIGGQYCEDCGIGEQLAPDAPSSAFSAGYFAYARDKAKAEVLWQKALLLTGEQE